MHDEEEHLSESTLARYRDETLSPAELLAASDHLARCATCRAALQQSLGTGARARDWEADLLLTDAAESAEMLPRGKVTRFLRIAALAAAAAIILGLGWFVLGPIVRPAVLQDRIVSVRRDGSVTAKAAIPEHLRERLEQAMRERRVPLPDLADVRPRGGSAMMSAPAGDAKLRQIAPVGEVIDNTQPELQWTSVKGATRYRVILAEVASGAEQQVEVTGPSWTPPAPLAEGAVYEWEVYALDGENELAKAPLPPLPEARFRTLTAEARHDMEQARAGFRDSPLLLGIAAAEAGLLREAEAQFQRLVAEQPNSQLARDLLESVRKAQPAPSITNGAQ